MSQPKKNGEAVELERLALNLVRECPKGSDEEAARSAPYMEAMAQTERIRKQANAAEEVLSLWLKTRGDISGGIDGYMAENGKVDATHEAMAERTLTIWRKCIAEQKTVEVKNRPAVIRYQSPDISARTWAVGEIHPPPPIQLATTEERAKWHKWEYPLAADGVRSFNGLDMFSGRTCARCGFHDLGPERTQFRPSDNCEDS